VPRGCLVSAKGVPRECLGSALGPAKETRGDKSLLSDDKGLQLVPRKHPCSEY
jgi:hypothetical protein